MIDHSKFSFRHKFLQFLVASPADCGANGLAQNMFSPYAAQKVSRVSDAVNVFDFHEVAKPKLSLGHYAYMTRGSGHGLMQFANTQDFKKIKLRMRRFHFVITNK